MPRSRVKTVTWETVVDRLVDAQTRNIIRRKPKKSPYIFIEDKPTRKLSTLNPLRWEIIEDIEQAANICVWCKKNKFPKHLSIEVIIRKANTEEEINSEGVVFNWDQVMDIVEVHLTKYMKASSAKNIRADIRNLRKADTPFVWSKMKAWVFQKELSSRPFKNRLDALEQLRMAIYRKFGDEPEWLKRDDLNSLRVLHNASNKQTKRYQVGNSDSGVRGIPTKKEAESYFDALDDKYALQRWSIAMMMCYGMRNHELWHCSLIESNPKDKSYMRNIIKIPGNWRTKSKYSHCTFPIFEDWITKYNLIRDFEIMQSTLHRKAKPRIVSANDYSVKWEPGDSRDMGVCMNNDYLGNWITNQLRETLPMWKATVPNAKGEFIKSGTKEVVKPYDLRHAWAVHLATSPKWNHLNDTHGALAMGHSIEVHRKHYQRWISEDDSIKSFLKQVYSRAWYKDD